MLVIDTSKLTRDTSKTVLTTGYGYANCDKLDVSGIQALTNITPGTMKLLAIGTGQLNPQDITFNPPTTLVYTGTNGTTTATLNSTNPTVTIQRIGVISHLGTSDMGGHFIAFCKNSCDCQWYKYNDAQVDKSSFSEITSIGLPYVLFYSFIKK